MSRERPILFSAPMVRAILDGRKTQTRRPVTHRQVLEWLSDTTITPAGAAEWCHFGQAGGRLWVRETAYISPPNFADPDPSWLLDNEGRPRLVGYAASMDSEGIRCARDYGVKATRSIHMPRWASRITLEISSVRVERIQEITQDGARAEGIEDGPAAARELRGAGPLENRVIYPTTAFSQLWDSVYGGNLNHGGGPLAWNQNPWVWVIAFKRVDARLAHG